MSFEPTVFCGVLQDVGTRSKRQKGIDGEGLKAGELLSRNIEHGDRILAEVHAMRKIGDIVEVMASVIQATISGG